MWPVDASQCIAQLRKFVPSVIKSRDEKERYFATSLVEPILPRIQPTNLQEVEYGLDQWKSKIDATMQWSDPAREEELNQYVSHTRHIIAESHFRDYELSLHQKRRHEELLYKSISRKRLKPTFGALGIAKEDALAAIAKKRRKEDELVKKKEHNTYMRI